MPTTLEEALALIASLTTERDALAQEKAAYAPNRDRLLEENRTLKARMTEFETKATEAERLALEAKGEYKALYELAEQRRTERDEADKRYKVEQEKIRLETEVLRAFSDPTVGIVDPEDFQQLYGPRVTRNPLGELVVNEKGVDVPLSQFVTTLKADVRKGYLFKPVGGSGGGSPPGGNPPPNLNGDNPFKKGTTFNLTKQGQITKADPVKARALMIEAGFSEADINRRLK